jgi:hypothetical protein
MEQEPQSSDDRSADETRTQSQQEALVLTLLWELGGILVDMEQRYLALTPSERQPFLDMALSEARIHLDSFQQSLQSNQIGKTNGLRRTEST